MVFLTGVGDEGSEHVVQGNNAVKRMNCVHQEPAVDNFDLLSFSGKVSAGTAVMMDTASCCPEPAK